MLAKNELLEHIVSKLAHRTPSWDEVLNRFRETKFFLNNTYRIDTLSGFLAKIYLRVALEEICEKVPNVNLDIFRQEIITPDYTFIPEITRVTILDNKQNRSHANIDQVIMVDNLPVMLNIRLLKYYKQGYRGKEKKPLPYHRRGASALLEKKVITYLLKPFDQVSEIPNINQFGYVVIMYPEQINHEEPLQQSFERQGGIMVPFYETKLKFRSMTLPGLYKKLSS